MASQLMMQELKHIQNMIKDCRAGLREQIPPDEKSPKEKKPSILIWRKLDDGEHIKEIERRQISEQVQKLEQIYTDLTAQLPEPKSLVDIEEQIKLTNESIVVSLREYSQATEQLKLSENERAAYNREAEEDDSLLGGWMDLAIDPLALRGEEKLKDTVAFTGLKLYRLVGHSDDLQNSREDCISEYLTEAAKWNNLKLKAEIRKRKGERDAIPTMVIPNVNLFTVSDFPLKQPFGRQREFLNDIIAELNQPKELPDRPTPNERERLEERIKILRVEKAKVAANPELDAHERQQRLNMYEDKIQDETEKLKDLI